MQQQLRAIVRDLVPVEVDNLGLAAALQALAQRISEAHDIDCSFSCVSPIDVEYNLKATQLYRIAQEAVNNAVSHAKANQITIHLGQNEDRLQIEVCDDGVGFEPQSLRSDGLGLRSMAYRARLVGAHFDIQQVSGGGTKIVCSLTQ